VEEVFRWITALEHGDEEEAESVHGEDDGADDDDLALPPFQNLVHESARPAHTREQESLRFVRRKQPMRVSALSW
jgi:hypothetical protein